MPVKLSNVTELCLTEKLKKKEDSQLTVENYKSGMSKLFLM